MDKVILELDAKDVASIVLKKFGENAKKAGKDVNSLQKDLRGAADEIPGLSNAMGILSKGPMVALAAGAVAVATGFAVMVKSSIDMADNMNDMSLKLGISTEKLSVLKLYADQSGTSIEDVADSMAKLGVKLASGDKDLAELGITAGNVDEAFFQVADKIASTEDPMIRLKIATDAFGKSGKDMLPMLVQGGDALRAMSEEAPIVSSRLASMSDEFNDKVAVMQGKFVSIGLTITESILPTLTTFLDYTNAILGSVTKVNDKIAEFGYSKAFKILVGAATGNVGLIGAGIVQSSPDKPETGIVGGSQRGYQGESLVKPKTVQEIEAEEAAIKKAGDDRLKAAKDAKKKFDDWKEGIRKERQSENKQRVLDLYAGVGGTEVDVSELSKQQINEETAKNFSAQKATEEVLDKPRQEQLKKEKEKNDKLIAMANTTAQALSTPFNQFGQDLFDSNKSLESSFSDLFGNIAESFSNMLIQMVAEMAAKAAIFGLFNMFTGGGFGTATGGLTSFLGIPGFATGTDYAPGGIALVGEQGPELVHLPRGSKVKTASETARTGIIQNVYITNQSLSEKQITDIVVKTQRRIEKESSWRATK